MARTKVAIGAAAGGGLIGYVGGKLTSGDLKELFVKAMDGFGSFLRQQGQYASFAIVMALCFGGVAIWAIRMLVTGKNQEIDRISAERDRFQKLVIEQWQSSVQEKGAKKEMTNQQQGLLILQFVVSASLLSYLVFLWLESRKEKLKFRFFAVRDQLLYQAATGVLAQDSQVFKVFYRAMNVYVSQLEEVTLMSFVRASIAARTELAKENQQKLLEALGRAEPEVQKTINDFIGIVIEAMLHNSFALNLLVQVAVHCKRLFAWMRELKQINIPIDLPSPSLYRVYETYQFYDHLRLRTA